MEQHSQGPCTEIAYSVTYSEQEAEIFRRQAAHRRVVSRELHVKTMVQQTSTRKVINKQEAHRCVDHCAFLLLQLDNPAFDAIFDDEFDSLNRAVLAQTVDSIHGLILDSRVPRSLISPHEQLTEAETQR